jgi:outer membrane biosynthesis protein TonB
MAEVEFVVDEAGVPEKETARVVRTNNPDFAAATLAVVPRWRYRPATIDGQPVRQIVREKQGVSEVVVAAPAGQMPQLPARAPKC